MPKRCRGNNLCVPAAGQSTLRGFWLPSMVASGYSWHRLPTSPLHQQLAAPGTEQRPLRAAEHLAPPTAPQSPPVWFGSAWVHVDSHRRDRLGALPTAVRPPCAPIFPARPRPKVAAERTTAVRAPACTSRIEPVHPSATPLGPGTAGSARRRWRRRWLRSYGLPAKIDWRAADQPARMARPNLGGRRWSIP